MDQSAKIDGLPAVDERFTASLARSSEFVLRIDTRVVLGLWPAGALEASHKIRCHGPLVFERRGYGRKTLTAALKFKRNVAYRAGRYTAEFHDENRNPRARRRSPSPLRSNLVIGRWGIGAGLCDGLAGKVGCASG